MHWQVIVASVREGRIGLAIGEWAYNVVKSIPGQTVELVDLKDYPLSMSNEPNMPRSQDYVTSETQNWSKKIQEGGAYIFISPEYNRGYPASLKNALDHLWYEWVGKPAVIVNYASRGGPKSAQQLQDIIGFIGMVPAEKQVLVSLHEVGWKPPFDLSTYDSLLIEQVKAAKPAPPAEKK